jgi:hypothetical protein
MRLRLAGPPQSSVTSLHCQPGLFCVPGKPRKPRTCSPPRLSAKSKTTALTGLNGVVQQLHRYARCVLPLPGLSIATGVSSACSTGWRSRSAARTSTSGCSCTLHSPSQCAIVDRAIRCPARSTIASWRYSGRWSRYLATSTWTRRSVVGSPLSMTCGAPGACWMVSQHLQTHLLRMWRSTVHTPGWKSSFSATSLPTRCTGVPQPQVVSSGSWRISRSGRLAGSFSRLGICFSPLALANGAIAAISAATAARSPSSISSSRLLCSAL